MIHRIISQNRWSGFVGIRCASTSRVGFPYKLKEAVIFNVFGLLSKVEKMKKSNSNRLHGELLRDR